MKERTISIEAFNFLCLSPYVVKDYLNKSKVLSGLPRKVNQEMLSDIDNNPLFLITLYLEERMPYEYFENSSATYELQTLLSIVNNYTFDCKERKDYIASAEFLEIWTIRGIDSYFWQLIRRLIKCISEENNLLLDNRYIPDDTFFSWFTD